MTGVEFFVTSSGRDAKSAFDTAVALATKEDPYAGIAAKTEFVEVEENWKSLKARLQDAIDVMQEAINHTNSLEAGEFDKDELVKQIEEVEIGVWSNDLLRPKTKHGALKAMRQQVKYWRGLRDSCGRSMTAQEVAEALLYDVCDERLCDTCGPAGCIDLTPKVTGKRKAKRFLFFGLSAS